jgi:hypothetical protein
VHKVQHKLINIQVRDPIQKEQKGLECAVVWRTGLSGVPPDSVRCTRTVQGPRSHSRVFAGVLRYNSPDCAVCHQTVRCATGLSGEPADNGSLRATVDCKITDKVNSAAAEVKAAKSEGTRLSGVAPDCPVWHRTVRCGTRLSGAARRQSSNRRLRSEP